ncbi:HAD family hydrolase [Paenibacillus tarimensis]
MDETLFDFKTAEYLGVQAFHRECGFPIHLTEDAFYSAWCSIGQFHFDRYLKGELSFPQLQAERVKDVLKNYADISQITDQEALEHYFIYLRNYENHWKAFQDVKPCLEKIIGHRRLGIISNGDLTQQTSKLEKLGILNDFEIIVTSGDTGIAKPDKKIFEIACEKAGMEPDQCIYIGDNLKTDVLPCKEIGMKGIWLNRNGSSSSSDISNDIPAIESLNELPAHII